MWAENVLSTNKGDFMFSRLDHFHHSLNSTILFGSFRATQSLLHLIRKHIYLHYSD